MGLLMNRSKRSISRHEVASFKTQIWNGFEITIYKRHRKQAWKSSAFWDITPSTDYIALHRKGYSSFKLVMHAFVNVDFETTL
jgi:hypothetical protein